MSESLQLNTCANFMIKYHEPRVENNVNEIINYMNTKKTNIIFDIGSNIGSFTKLLSKRINYKEIHLFEASTEIYNYSKIYLNDIDNLYINNIALSNNNENKILYKCPKDIKEGKKIKDDKIVLKVGGCNGNSNIGWNTMLQSKDPGQPLDNFHDYMDKEIVNCITLDKYVKENNITNIDLIKMDIEGYEGQGLEGAFETIQKFKPLLYIEVSWGIRHPQWNQNKYIYKKLLNMDYEIKNCENFFTKRGSVDVIFQHK